MIRLHSLILGLGAAAALLAAAAAPAAAASPVMPRDRVVVQGAEIRLGDLFRNVGDAVDAPVAASPLPGDRIVFDSGTLASIAAASGLDWRPMSRFDRVIVERASVVVDASQIESALQRELAGRNVEIELENRGISFHLPADRPVDLDFENLSIDSAGRRVTATVTASGSGIAGVRVAARLHAVTDLPVLTEPVMPGEAIRPEQLGWAKVRIDRVHTAVATETRQLVGLMPRRPLRPGAPIATRDLQQRLLVARGALVTITLQTPFMSLSTQGRALDDGAMGAVIRVSNSQTKTTVEGTVVGPDLIAVRPHAPSFAQLNGR